MRLFLKIIFGLFFAGILAATLAASFDRSVVTALKELWPDLWFKATLCDTYFSFLTVYLWIAYKETNIISRILWFVLVMATGTFAISSYILIQLFKLKKDDGLEKLFLRN